MPIFCGLMRRRRSFLVCFLALFLIACAGPKERNDLGQNLEEACRTFLWRLDSAIDDADVKDGAYVRIPGYPYFRTNRFWSAHAKTAQDSESFTLLFEKLHELNIAARKREIQNMPLSTFQTIFGADQDRSDIEKKAEECTSSLFKTFLKRSEQKTEHLTSFEVPQEYSGLMRALGAYPLVSLPVAYLTLKARREFQEWFNTPLSKLPVYGEEVTFSPMGDQQRDFSKLQDLLKEYLDNPLYIPHLTQGQIKELAHWLAPNIVQDVAGGFDQFGEVIWSGGHVEIDIIKPTLYYYITYAFLKGHPVLQVNYALWYEGRRGPNAPWVERGPIDGLTIRITIDRSGHPAMVDIMNNCGCYHMFVPKKGLVKSIKQKSFAMDAFMPQELPGSYPEKPLSVRVVSGWHQVAKLYTQDNPRPDHSYQLLPYSALESLAHGNGQRESIFTEKGIVKGSDRIEPLFLFSMGVPKVGYMRQRGHHAISLVGKEHFDDPYLIEKNFILK